VTTQPSPPAEERATSLSTALSLYVPAVMLSMGLAIAAPALPAYAQSFDVSFTTASLIVIVVPWGGVVSTFPTGYLIDRLGRRPVLLAGPIITAATAFLTALAPSFAFLLVCRFMSGASAQMWQQARLAMIADMGGDRERGKMITWMGSIENFGMLFAPALGGAVAVYDIRLPFVLHGILVLIALIPSFKLIKETPEGRRSRQDNAGDWGYVFTELKRPQMLYFLSAQVFANLTRGNIQGIMNLYMAYAYGTGPQALGLVATANSILIIPIGFMSGFVMDRYGRKKTIVPGFIGLALSAAYLAWTVIGNASFELFLVGFFALHMSQAVTAGNMQVLGSDLAPARARGRFIGIWRFLAQLGQATSPAMFSLFALIGYAASFGFVGTCGLITALIVGLKVKETVGRRVTPVVEEAKDDAPMATVQAPATAEEKAAP
jgi:MFS family permease